MVFAGEGAISASGAVTETITEKGKRVAKEILFRNKSILFTLGVFGLLFIIVATSLFSCSASIQGGGTLIRVTSYVSTDEDNHEAENIYSALEEALNRQINNMESTHSGYDEYNYQIDEIGHNPYHLISYLTAKYGVWTIDDVTSASVLVPGRQRTARCSLERSVLFALPFLNSLGSCRTLSLGVPMRI